MTIQSYIPAYSSNYSQPLDRFLGCSLSFQRIDDIRLHELYRPSRQPGLYDCISDDDYLANPIIISQTDRYLFAIDGHHRLATLKKLGCTHILTQSVPLSDQTYLGLETWQHLARVDSPEEIIANLIDSGLKVEETDPQRAESKVPSHQGLCWIGFYNYPSSQAYHISAGQRRLVDALSIVTNMYQPTRITERSLPGGSPIELDKTFKKYSQMNMFVRFSQINSSKVVQLVNDNEQIPAGITRVVLKQGRILGVNVPLILLKDISTDKDREEWLLKLYGQIPDYYQGPTFFSESPSLRRYEEPVYVYDAETKPVEM